MKENKPPFIRTKEEFDALLDDMEKKGETTRQVRMKFKEPQIWKWTEVKLQD